jgi:NAD-dependent DNA ligase
MARHLWWPTLESVECWRRSVAARKEAEDPREKLRRHKYRYFVLDDPEISDAVRDRLMNRLRKFEPAYANLTRLGRWLSPTPRSP